MLNIKEINVTEIIPYGKNPRKNDKAVPAVKRSIQEFGFKIPIIIDKDNVIVCGHTRVKAAKELGYETVPAIMADDLTEEQIKAFRLADNKVAEIAEWDELLLDEELAGIINMDMSEFGFDLKDDADTENQYNKEIKIPQYEVTGANPTLAQLLDESKAEELRERIASSNVDDDVKAFLLKAATRHYCFNYKNVAEYYAHAPKEVQELMEDSALVIIDYDDAIAKGYVELSTTLQELLNDGQ